MVAARAGAVPARPAGICGARARDPPGAVADRVLQRDAMRAVARIGLPAAHVAAPAPRNNFV